MNALVSQPGENVLSAFALTPVLDVETYPTTSQNQVWRIRLSQHNYVLKAYARLSETDLLQQHCLLDALHAQGIPLSLPLRRGNGETIFSSGEKCYVLFEHIDAQQVAVFSTAHIVCLASLLATVHAQELSALNVMARDMTPQVMSLDVLQPVLRDAAEPLISPQHVDTLMMRCTDANAALPSCHDKPRVLSHGDFIPRNMLWRDNQTILIDWDYWGWQIRELDIHNAAINAAGIGTPDFNPSRYQQFVAAYAQASRYQVNLPQRQLTQVGYLSWINWLVFCLQQYRQSTHAKLSQYQYEIESCLLALTQLERCFA